MEDHQPISFLDNSDHDMVSAHAQREMSIAAVESVAAAAAGTK